MINFLREIFCWIFSIDPWWVIPCPLCGRDNNRNAKGEAACDCLTSQADLDAGLCQGILYKKGGRL